MSKFHSQSAQLIAVIAQNIPDMSSDVMQGWIENPEELKKVLAILNSPSPVVMYAAGEASHKITSCEPRGW